MENTSVNNTMDVLANVSTTDNFNGTTSYNGIQVAIGLATLTTISLLGLLLNTGVLVIMNVAELVKKDYRMVYYVFITFGDWCFSLNGLITVCTIAFKEAAIFKKQWVCMTIMTGGVVCYEGSAMCIILLMFDLIRSVHSPHGWTERGKRKFAVVSCCCCWLMGLFLALLPYAYAFDSDDIGFCSVANAYGPSFFVYNILAVSCMTILFFCMAVEGAILVRQIRNLQQQLSVPSTVLEESKTDCFVKELTLRQGSEAESTQSISSKQTHVSDLSLDGKDDDCKISADDPDRVSPSAPRNTGVYLELTDQQRENTNSLHTKVDKKYENTEEKITKMTGTISSVENPASLELRKRRLVQYRKKFKKACQTVACIEAAFVGCCLAYYVQMFVDVTCVRDCDHDNVQKRTLRVLFSLAVYLLPVINPILYTFRFVTFRKSAVLVLGRICCACRRH